MHLIFGLVTFLSGVISFTPAMVDVTSYIGQHEGGTKALAEAFTKAT
jgi:hypothetical protein